MRLLRRCLATPTLFPFVADELDILNVIWKNKILDVDIMINYNYQEIIFDLLQKYVEPGLSFHCLEEISDVKDLSDAIESFKKTHYESYYKYFLVLAYREYGKELSLSNFKKWLGVKRYYFCRIGRNPKYIYELQKKYNSIVIPKIPLFNPMDNMFNRLYNLPPNFLDVGEIFNKSVESLINGGKIHVIDRESYNMVIEFKNEKIRRIDNIIFEKDIPEREEFRLQNRWL